jgi:uncharacterized membrane protein
MRLYPGVMAERRGSRAVSGPLATAALLGLSSTLLVVRNVVSGHGPYDFLLWNAFLALIPYAFAVLVRVAARRGAGRLPLVLLGAAWLLFLPNAFYIVTDFVHLGDVEGMSVWYDACLIGGFALFGLVVGFASVRVMESLARARSAAAARVLAVGSLVLSGVGIYLGRVLQFNSWDVVARPGRVAASFVHALADPFAYSWAFGAMAAIAVSLTVAYAVMRTAAALRAKYLQRHPARWGTPGAPNG